jgi:type IV pilus assembly protein PilC
MANFEYTAILGGSRSSGMLTANSRGEAIADLRARGAVILNLQPTNKTADKAKSSTPLDGLFVSKSQLEIAFRQLSSVLAADVPILLGLDTIGRQCRGRLKEAFSRIHERVRNGNPLSQAFREEAPFVGRVAIGLITVGEANGTLSEMLDYSAELMEKARRLKNDLVQAFSYPCFVILVGIGVAWFMTTKVIPKILGFIKGQQGDRAQLPAVTQLLVDVTAFFQQYGLIVIAVPIVLAIILVVARKNPASAPSIDASLLRIPLVGKAFREHANTMWCRTLSALLGSGVEIVTALELVEHTMGNQFVANQFRQLRQSVREGRSLTKSLEETALFRLCPIAHTMVLVSESSGSLDRSLAQVADYCEDALQRRVKLLSKLVEPAMYGVVGGMVGFVYFAFFMAMMSASRSAI